MNLENIPRSMEADRHRRTAAIWFYLTGNVQSMKTHGDRKQTSRSQGLGEEGYGFLFGVTETFRNQTAVMVAQHSKYAKNPTEMYTLHW